MTRLGGMPVIRAAGPADAGTVRSLFGEYVESLGIDLSFQGVDADLADPLGVYELVLLAADGCVALRGVDAVTAELKRLYVRPTARGRGLGRLLAEAAIAAARERGYRRLLLDTLPSMAEARRLYGSLGFRETAPYRPNPIPGTSYLELELG
jgi:GNAT superfamily N-acetyltransferase